LLAGTLADGQQVEYALAPGRALYLVPARGAVTVNGVDLGERDGAAVIDEPALRIIARGETELVVVEVAA